MEKLDQNLAQLTSNTIRLLAADGVQSANSGHPGMPMGMADCAYVLWNHFLKFNAKNPDWINRDRFVLSAGHGSMLLYSLLHLYGYDVSIEDLGNFRQWGSKTPGHPEFGEIKGIETTTGPLGQGFANGIGMAIAAKMTAARFNTEKYNLFGTHKIYAIVSDGDLMEGLSSETGSLAGHLKLNNVVYLYDDNNITIEGRTDLAFSESIDQRFKAFGWLTKTIDGHNHREIFDALEWANEDHDKPILLISETIIGTGSPNKKDTSGVHGSPLGDEELKLTKKTLGFPEDKKFYIPEEVTEHLKSILAEKEKSYSIWKEQYENWRNEFPEKAKEFDSFLAKEVPDNLEELLIAALPEKTAASRSLSGKVMQKIAEVVPSFVGGSADLKPSTNTYLDAYASITGNDFSGRNFHYGIREHAMGSINNGIALYGGYIPFGSTFLVFSDYMRPPIRLAALSKMHQIFVYTHDSIFVGEDGPTHQPVEQVPALRTIQGLQVMRPADSIEVAVCWALAVKTQTHPHAILLTRQKVGEIKREDSFDTSIIAKGGYVVARESGDSPKIVILATGSEVAPAIGAKELLEQKRINTRVVSVPCKEIFESQSEEYLREVIPATVKHTFVVEATSGFGWSNYFNLPMTKLCIDGYGKSAPYEILEDKFGFTAERIAENVEKTLR
ncbi:MAG: transketolase [Melioribacteraceae bacterium]|nr:transketolase [Melioribacteraceae bacterium]MCF8264978.1 transketolase [Melioribacteraceae bacterium]MCF8431631.1 transketolase [Melioribacteraceae bacterium]